MADDLAVDDVREIIAVGRERGGDLLTAGEGVILDRIASLEGQAASLYARLSGRRPSVFELQSLTCPGVTSVAEAASELMALELADSLVPWERRAAALPMSALKESLRGLGLRVGGRRAELVERLQGHTHWRPGGWIRIRHKALIHRLATWYFLRAYPDRSTLVVERLGHIRWPDYAVSSTSGLFQDRRSLLAWEALRRPGITVDDALTGLRTGAYRAPGRLNLGRSLGKAVIEVAHGLEKNDPAAARHLYLAVGECLELAGELAPRVARTLEAESKRIEALNYLARLQHTVTGVDRMALNRAGKRLARTLRRGWAPDAPLRTPRSRTLRLPIGARVGPRPGYRIHDLDLPVEQAICATLRGHDRQALHAEGAIWSTLFSLLFADCFFLDVPGALPVRFLSAPLDLGTPAFRQARGAAIEAVLAGVRAGEAPDRIRDADDRFRGLRLSGATWSLADAEILATVANGIGPAGLSTILLRILQGGRRVTRGLPDLVILPGDPIKLDDAFPTRLDGGLHLVELKGPSDTVRDEQQVWFDRLLRTDVAVELWQVRPSDMV